MIINLCYTASANELVSKVITTRYSRLNAHIKENSSVISPTLIIDTVDVTGINYLYIPAWGRYYYITDIVAIDASHIQITARCDVLKSFESEIRRSSAIIDKQQYDEKTSRYINDNSYVVQCRDAVNSIAFNGGFTASDNILITAGG